MIFVGSVSAERLASLGIDTIGAIANAGREQIKALLGRSGETIWEYAMGLDNSPVKSCDDIGVPKSIGNSTTFPHDLRGRRDLRGC
ncbi:MAG: hypothetical protein R2881_07595 [Eubacteriales bacterium]